MFSTGWHPLWLIGGMLLGSGVTILGVMYVVVDHMLGEDEKTPKNKQKPV